MANQLNHDRYMHRAIELAGNNPRWPFGALLVRQSDGVILAEGWNHWDENPTWHGEIDAINRCASLHPGIDWTTLALFTTGEPCPMCQSAILWAGIPLVVYGSSIPYLQSLGVIQIDLRAEEVTRRAPFARCQIIGGALEAECNALFAEAFKNIKAST